MSTTDDPTATSPSASEARQAPARFVVLGNPGSNRVGFFQQALARRGHEAARVVPWAAFLAGRVALPEIVRPGDHVRIESPGRDWEVERALLHLGALHWDEGDAPYKYLSAPEVEALEFDKGRIYALRQWFVGWREALGRVGAQLSQCAPHSASGAPEEVATMFDKPRCHALLQKKGVSVPRSLGTPLGFDELAEVMQAARMQRVFVKAAHGSSASGVVALRTDGRRFQATTTAEVVDSGGEVALYNSRRVRVYEEMREVRALIDALCRHRAHVEEWVPKAGFAGKSFDLRVVVIAGRSRHTVARLSRHPMTNLHLLNERGDVEVLRQRVGEAAWSDAARACEEAAACFPQSVCAGVDVLFAPGFERHAVLEVNAFGDLLPGVLHEGADTYEAQVQVLEERAR